MAIITLSRQVAAHGDEVAQFLAEKLNYKFISRKDIEKRILELGFSESKLSKYDERKPGFFASLVKDRDEYLNYVQYSILEAAAKQNVIFIGRGAFAVLQKVPNNISIRLVADQQTRINRLKEEFNWNEKQAMQRIQESDTNRKGFHSSFYNVDVDSPEFFHGVLNTGLMSVEDAADIIANIVKTKVTPQQEEDGNIMIAQLLQAQTMVNKLYFDYKIHIEFMHITIENNNLTLHGVTDSPALVEQALSVIRRELPKVEAKSAVSFVHDFKTFQ